MAEYFLLHDAEWFEGRARPALTAAWRGRDFDACRALAESLLPSARRYTECYRAGEVEPLLAAVVAGAPFDRALWRHLVGEVLLFGAVEIPEPRTCADTLCCLLAPDRRGERPTARARLAPIQQAHAGSHELAFGAALYRPDHAGINAREDVRRLAAYLESLRPEQWTVADLAALGDAVDDADRAEELEFARESLAELTELFARARARLQVVIHEEIY